ncbi:MAG: tRNA epoxyqueuosine(34) reductase QueG [Acidimicrobiaceae bacterium]|nr:tRNA epoxyqueuosine(34) reductase QueG [Acidimicrobiaceae bacterium]
MTQLADEHLTDDLSRMSSELGLIGPRVCGVDLFEFERVQIELAKDIGRSSTMAFTFNKPARSADPNSALEGARSILSFAMGYPGPSDELASGFGPLEGEIAYYAKGDFYGEIRRRLSVVAEELKSRGYRARVTVDENHAIDKAIARRSGLGWMGKNTLILTNVTGPFVLLGEIFTDAELAHTETLNKSCGKCDKCQVSCPTGALDEDYLLDARLCLSWLLQKQGPFPYELRGLLGLRFYGCDECLTSCPVGKKTRLRLESTASAVDPIFWLLRSDRELIDHFGYMYIPKRDPSHLRRNLLLVLGNSGSKTDETREVLATQLAHFSAVVRSTAVWAASKLGFLDLLALVGADQDELVHQELARIGIVPPTSD